MVTGNVGRKAQELTTTWPEQCPGCSDMGALPNLTLAINQLVTSIQKISLKSMEC